MFVCLFDIDGTLLSSGGAGKAAMAEGMATAFGVPAYADGIPFSGRTDRAIARDLLRFHDIADTPEHGERLVHGYLRRLPAALAKHNGQVLPGIAALLQKLAQRDDVAVGLLTGNIREGARVKLGHFGLVDHFAFGGFGDHHFDRDDVAREALAAVRQRYGPDVRTQRIWVIGDTPLDVQCARAIGAKSLAVATGGFTRAHLEPHGPTWLVENLSDTAAAQICG